MCARLVKKIWCDYIIDCSCYSEENKNRHNFLCATAWITIVAKSDVWIAITFSLFMQMPRFTYHFNSFNLLFKAIPNLVQNIAFEKNIPVPTFILSPNHFSMQWAQAGNKACRQVIGSCSYASGSQDNWLITQYINTTVNGKALSQVVVRVNFSLNGCLTGGSCQQSFLLQMYQTRNIDPSGSINRTNYAAFSGSRVTVGSNPSGTVVDAQDVTVALGASGGLYLAAQDTGTCVSIFRLTVLLRLSTTSGQLYQLSNDSG